jgi:AbrB family looped-hinge helix DNA binding protein
MKIGERGQVTIPKNIREKYGLMPYIEVEFVPEENGVLIKKKGLRSNPVEQVYGILKKKADTDSYIEAIRGR